MLVAASRSRSTRRLHRNPRADCAGRPSPQSQSREWWEGKQTQTRPSCRQAESLSTGRRCLVLKTLARPKRVPPAPRPWRSAVTRAKTCAPSTTSPGPRILSDRMHGTQVGRTPSFRRVPPSTQTPPTPQKCSLSSECNSQCEFSIQWKCTNY